MCHAKCGAAKEGLENVHNCPYLLEPIQFFLMWLCSSSHWEVGSISPPLNQNWSPDFMEKNELDQLSHGHSLPLSPRCHTEATGAQAVSHWTQAQLLPRWLSHQLRLRGKVSTDTWKSSDKTHPAELGPNCWPAGPQTQRTVVVSGHYVHC